VTAPIDRAYVEILPEFKKFGAQAKAGIDKSMAGVSSGVKSGLRRTETESASTGKRIGRRLGSGIKEGFRAVGGGNIAGLLAVGGLIEFGKKSVETFESVTRESLGLQRVMGGTVKAASAWRGAMQLGGISNQQFMVSVRSMSKQIVAAGGGKKSAFDALNISVFDAFGKLRQMDDLLPQISDRFKDMAPGAEKNALAVQLFGRSGIQMLPFLNRGSAGLEALRKKADELGIVVGDKQVAAFKKSVVAQREFTARIQGIQIWVGEHLLPALDRFFEVMNVYVLPTIRNLGGEIKTAIGVIRSWVDWINRNRVVLSVVAGVITTLLLPAIIAFAVAEAVSLSESIALWTLYKVEAITAAARAVIAYTVISASAVAASVTAIATFAVMVGKWVWLGAQSLLAAAKVALAWIIAMGPIAIVIAAVVGLVTLIVLNWNKIVAFTKMVWNAIWGFIRDHWRLIVVLLLGGLPALVAFIVAHWQAIARFVSKVWRDIWGFIRDHWKLIVTLLTGGLAGLVILVVTKWTAIKNAIARALGDVLAFIKRLPRQIQDIFNGALTWLLNAGIRIITGLLHGARDHGWTLFKAWLIGIPRAIYSTIFRIDDFFITLGINIMKGIWAGVKRIWNDVVGWFKRLPGWIMKALGIHSPPDWAISAGAFIMKGLIKGLIGGTFDFNHFLAHFANLARKKLMSTLSLTTVLQGQGQVSGWAGSLQAYAASLFPALGWAKTQLASLIALWNGESGWNPRALNKSSGAYGIPQALPASKMDAYGNRNDPTVQIRWGLDYIRSRYGNPANAYRTWLGRSPHWYGTGMAPTLFTRPTLIGVGEGGPETVSVSRGGAGGIDYERLAEALARALGGMAFRFDGDGLARIVTRHQDARNGKGTRR
jgi:hypothetical protein